MEPAVSQIPGAGSRPLIHLDSSFLVDVLRGARRGESVAAMDLLIAAGALAADTPLVTRNRERFDRRPGLRVVGS